MTFSPLVALPAEDDGWDAILAVRLGAATRPTAGPFAALYGPVAAAPGTRRVIGQVGQSLDGRVATPAGDARDISGPEGLAHLHRLRALVDAVVVGAGTVLSDDPRLTVRLARGPNPARVAIDPSGRVPDTARIFADDGVRRLVVQADDRPRPAGVEVIRLPRTGGALDPAAVITALAARGLSRVLVEGGARTLAPMIAGGLVDRLHVSIAPLIIGAGPTGLALPPVGRLCEAMRPSMRHFRIGSEIVVDCDLRAHVPLATAAE